MARAHPILALSIDAAAPADQAWLANAAEQAGIDMLILEPSRGLEPSLVAAWLASSTTSIGLIASASPTSFQPYNLARRIASLDIIGGGRAGWLCPADAADRDRLNEYCTIVRGLWRSWDADALLLDKVEGRFFDPEKMHVLDHHGAHFQVRGPLNVARSPQDAPLVVMQNGGDGDFDLAPRHADLVIADRPGMPRAATAKRTVPLLHRLDAGEPGETADAMREALARDACDGFVLTIGELRGAPPLFEELDRRGLTRPHVPGETLRARLGLHGAAA